MTGSNPTKGSRFSPTKRKHPLYKNLSTLSTFTTLIF